MIMLASVQECSRLRPHLQHPADIGNRSSCTIYVQIDNIEEQFEQAKKCGAEIVVELAERPYQEGAKDYVCKDMEGYLWSFGTYDPWKI